MTDEARTGGAMADAERLLHYVLGIVQGKIATPHADDPLRDAWDEYKRMGFDPLAEDWPVLTLSPPLPEPVLDSTRAAYDELRLHVVDHGMTPEVFAALTGMARVLGEQPPRRPGDRRKAAEERTADEIEPETLVDDESLCARCRIMDDVASVLVERDGGPWCERCQTNGSLERLRG